MRDHSGDCSGDRPGHRSGQQGDPHQPARLRAVQVRSDDLVRLRLVFIAFVRLLGLAMACASIVPLGSWLAEGIQDGDLWMVSYYWPRMVSGFALVAVGLALLFLGGPIGRTLMRARVGSVACPECGFHLTTLDNGRCTECGYGVSPALPGLAVGPLERVLAARMVAGAVVRFVGFVILGWAGIELLAFLAPTYFPDWFDDYGYGYGWSAMGSLARAAVLLVLAGAIIAGARPLGAVLVPMSWVGKLADARREGA